MTDLTAIEGRQQRTWAAGDFAMIATTAIIVGELLCEAAARRVRRRVVAADGALRAAASRSAAADPLGSGGAAARDTFRRELIELVQRFNRSGGEAMVVPADYLEVVATRR